MSGIFTHATTLPKVKFNSSGYMGDLGPDWQPTIVRGR